MARFILTKELGRLARWLRILGFDTVYFKEDNRARVLLIALRQERILITRCKVLFDKVSLKAVYVKEEMLEAQLKKVIESLRLDIQEDKMFTRCTLCNTPLAHITKEKIKEIIPQYVYKTQNEFMICPQCKRVYWQGSHWGKVNKVIAKLLH